MEGDEYSGVSGWFHDSCYCHRHTDLSQGRQAIVADFPSEAWKLNWDQAVNFMHWLWLNLHASPSSDYGVGESLSRMMFLCLVPVCRQFVRLVGKHVVPPSSACIAMRSWTYLACQSTTDRQFLLSQRIAMEICILGSLKMLTASAAKS